MAAPQPPQRRWHAACPNCGADVAFASAASASAVCSYCQSTLLREGEALRRIGSAGELFNDHSPLQLGVNGRYQGAAFSLVGRLQYGYEGGSWNEWHALFDTGKSGWLSEDNGAYVFSFDAAASNAWPQPSTLRAGQRIDLDGRAWDVASVQKVRLLAAQGELPRPPAVGREFGVADLRNAAGEVATLDGSDAAVQCSLGRAVALSALALSGLRESSDKTLQGRSLACPSCGAALAVTLSTTQSITCAQCHAVVDVSKGVGAELAHFAQTNTGATAPQPQIALGSTGYLALDGQAAQPWQVVGYMERCTAPQGEDEEQTFWREYLLYNVSAGFAFLVDASDGWSCVRPITGAPQQRGSQALWAGDSYVRTETYAAKTSWVLGEFYWRVQAGEVIQVADYVGAGSARRKRLGREQSANEVTWSAGEVLDAATVAEAFRIEPGARAALQRDTAPLGSALAGTSLRSISSGVVVFVVLVLVIILIAKCSGDDCDQLRSTFGEASAEYQQCARGHGGGVARSGGGSYGGYSSGGGGHK